MSGMDALLRAGLSNAEVAARLRVRKSAVAVRRRELGVAPRPRALAGLSLVDAYRARTEPVAGGHLVWCGGRVSNGAPLFSHQGRRVSPYRVAFRDYWGREPVGQVRRVCPVAGCVAGRCLEDAVGRARLREQLRALGVTA